MARKRVSLKLKEYIDAAEITDELEEFIAEYEESLAIDENGLEEALIIQTTNYYAVSKRLSLEQSRRDAAKQHLRDVEARVDSAIRIAVRENGEKVTEREVESRRTNHSDIRDAHNLFMRVDRGVKALEALKDSWSQRSYILKELTALWLASYYGDSDSASADRSVRSAKAKNTKKKIKESRRARDYA